MNLKNRKLTYKELSNIEKGYYAFARYEYNGQKGYIYKMGKLSDKSQEYIKLFGNTALFYSVSQYAPEQKYVIVFLADKLLKKQQL